MYDLTPATTTGVPTTSDPARRASRSASDPGDLRSLLPGRVVLPADDLYQMGNKMSFKYTKPRGSDSPVAAALFDLDIAELDDRFFHRLYTPRGASRA